MSLLLLALILAWPLIGLSAWYYEMFVFAPRGNLNKAERFLALPMTFCGPLSWLFVAII